MFGSSEDRARQLAGRHRKERKTSGSSYTSCRSFTSSTQNPTQLQTTYTFMGRDAHHINQTARDTSQNTSSYPPHSPPHSNGHTLGNKIAKHKNSHELSPADLSIRGTSSLFTDLSAYSSVPSTLHESADQSAAHLQTLLIHQKNRPEHLSTILYGNPSAPNLTSSYYGRRAASYSSSLHLPSRHIVSHPSKLLTGVHVTSVMEAVHGPNCAQSQEVGYILILTTCERL